MNLYFLLEDSRSFFNVLPHWLNFALPDFAQIFSLFHLKYLQEMLRCSLHRNYSKKSPLVVSTMEYYAELLNRIKSTDDLRSLADFFNFIDDVQTEDI